MTIENDMEELIKIQSELKAPKNLYNSFGKYKYRNAEGIMESVKPLLKKYDCYLTLTDDIFMVGDRYYLKATATLFNKEGKHVMVSALAREDETKKGMDGSQITGTSSSYARKYALNGLFLIDDTKDADTDEYQNERAAKAKKDAPKKAVPVDRLEQAKAQCEAAKSKDELMAVWNSFDDLHNNSDFMLAMSTKKKEVV